MFNKPILLFLFSLIATSNNKGQTFMDGAGATIYVMTADISTSGSSYTAIVSFTNFTYFPKFLFKETDRSSISIGIPAGAGIGVSSSTGGGETKLYYGFDLPVVADFNMGRKSTQENDSRLGWYIGAGFGYMFTNWTDGYSNDKLNSYGPLFRSGIRFGAGTKHPDWATTIGLFFKPGLEKTKFKTFGIAVLNEF